eukprot:10237280-Alexandrium_andersonii.AAC.1
MPAPVQTAPECGHTRPPLLSLPDRQQRGASPTAPLQRPPGSARQKFWTQRPPAAHPPPAGGVQPDGQGAAARVETAAARPEAPEQPAADSERAAGGGEGARERERE